MRFLSASCRNVEFQCTKQSVPRYLLKPLDEVQEINFILTCCPKYIYFHLFGLNKSLPSPDIIVTILTAICLSSSYVVLK